MKKFKGLLHKALVISLATSMVIPNVSLVFAETLQENSVKTDKNLESKQQEKITEEIVEKEQEEATEEIVEKEQEEATEEVVEKEQEEATEEVVEKEQEEVKEEVVEKEQEGVTEKSEEEKQEETKEQEKEEEQEKIDKEVEEKQGETEEINKKVEEGQETEDKKQVEEDTKLEEEKEKLDKKPQELQETFKFELAGANYIDGTFKGKGQGRNGVIAVKVTIEEGKIKDLEVQQTETPSFWKKAEGLIEKIKGLEAPTNEAIDQVDAVTNATLSCNGIKEAVKDALAKALADETIFSSGEGTENAPYIIANAVQLRNFAHSVNEGTDYKDQHIKLLDNIDIKGNDWVPIGTSKHPFAGHFDGNEKSIFNLTIGTPGHDITMSEAGLFGKLEREASLVNITVEHAKIYVQSEKNQKVYVAGLVAIVDKNCKIDRCQVIESEISTKSNDNQMTYVGGLVGSLGEKSSITNSFVEASIHGESGHSVYVGGLAGISQNKALVMNNHVQGQVEASVLDEAKSTAKAISGGLVGMGAGVIYNCYADSTVNASNHKNNENRQEGALVGWLTANGCLLNSCFNSENGVKSAAIIFPEGSTFYDQVRDIKDYSKEEIKSLLHSHLSNDSFDKAKQIIKENLPKKDFAFEDNLSDKVFYDWESKGKKVSLSSRVWKERFDAKTLFELGEGTKEKPYMIKTEEQLRNFAVSLSDENTYAGQFIELVSDIDVSDAFWTCIGEGEYAFCGNFDGKNHVIKGITIKAQDGKAYDAGDDVYFGLFGVVGKGGIVKNVGVIDVDIDVYSKKTTAVGGICGVSDGGIIDSCYVEGSLKGETRQKGNNYAGGVVGWAIKGYVVNSYTDAKVESSVLPTALAMSGGIVGMTNRAVVANCYSLGETTGYTKRKLEVVESMAAVGGLVGVAGSPIVNCYTSSTTISKDYSYYVGAVIGWATGISETYNVYYNGEATQLIQDGKISPISDIGWRVAQGINEEGEVYQGSLVYNLKNKSKEQIQGQQLANELNANFKAFPLDTHQLPEEIKLKIWMVKDGKVILSDDYATRSYKEPAVEKPVLTGQYYDGDFYGKVVDADKKTETQVKIKVQNKRIIQIETDESFEGIKEIIQDVIKTNQAPDIKKSDSSDVTRFKSALRKATIKALKGDYTDYEKVNSAIFAGGEGTKENPYRVSTKEQLIKFAASINEVEHFENQYIVLTSDIDLEGVQWVPAGGRGMYAFAGHFDGKGHQISHMTIGSKEKAEQYPCAGLFAHINKGTVKNLGVIDSFINLSNATIPGIKNEKTYVGLIAGYVGVVAQGSGRGAVINQCYGTGKISVDSVEHNYVGSLVGMMSHSLLSNSWSDCSINAKSTGKWVYVGGLVGLPAFSVLLNNYADGEIDSDATVNKTQLGGIAGTHSCYSFNNYADVALQAKRQTGDIGAIAGRNTGVGQVSHCYGNVSSQQKAGDKVTTGMQVVGMTVQGDRFGKGQVIESKLQQEINKELIEVLNENKNLILNDKMYQELVKEWNLYIPQDFTLNTWELKDGKPHFTTLKIEESEVSDSPKHSHSQSKRSKNKKTSKKEEIHPNEKEQEINKESSQTKLANSFKDLKEDAWYMNAVQHVTKQGIMNGVSTSEFAPNVTTTRGMASMILWNMEGKPTLNGGVQFKDVESDSWYATAISWMAQNNLTSGVKEDVFEPNQTLTREQFAQLLYNYAKYKGYAVNVNQDIKSFKDRPSDWAKEAMKWAVSHEIINGKENGLLDSKGMITRAEMAQMIMKFQQLNK